MEQIVRRRPIISEGRTGMDGPGAMDPGSVVLAPGWKWPAAEGRDPVTARGRSDTRPCLPECSGADGCLGHAIPNGPRHPRE